VCTVHPSYRTVGESRMKASTVLEPAGLVQPGVGTVRGGSPVMRPVTGSNVWYVFQVKLGFAGSAVQDPISSHGKEGKGRGVSESTRGI